MKQEYNGIYKHNPHAPATVSLEPKNQLVLDDGLSINWDEVWKKWHNQPIMFEDKPRIPKCVPYQVCPKCDGEGWIFVKEVKGTGCATTVRAGDKCCPICQGKKVIPMHILNED